MFPDKTDIETYQILEDLSFSVSSAYRYILVFITPSLLILIGLFIGFWDLASLLDGLNKFIGRPIVVIVVFLIGIPVHEILHLLPWMVLAKVPPRSVKLGFQIRTLTPYAHVKIPLHARIYQLGTLVPGLVLGIVPYLLALINGNGMIAIFGLFFIYAAAGDFLVLWKIRGVRAGALLLDHPSRVGCYIVADPRENVL